jgi:hypothetical protein
VRDDYGDIDEFDLDEWAGMDVEVCPAPIIETDVDSIRQR